ncbi:MAG: ABC transporter permease [Acidobacteriota bacterium]|jgi:ribose/xylose/arabinose/galactoside ABC-type transport system permease subunit|nr:ABC transporter permease [Acidobacteriota bacterium]
MGILKKIENHAIVKKLSDTAFFRDTLNGSTLSILVSYIAICIVFSIMSPNFFRMGNFQSIGLAAAVTGIMAAGVTVPMLMAGLDLSQHAVAALTTVITAKLVVEQNVPMAAAIPMVLMVGILFGMFNGLLIAVFRIPPMIATMGSQYIVRGICYGLTSSRAMIFQHDLLRWIGRGRILGIPNSMLIMILVFLILSYVLNMTTYGRKVYSVGSNMHASFLAGISPVAIQMVAYAIAGLSSAIGGIVIVSQVGAAVPNAGVGSEMEIIAAVFLGGVATTGGRGSLFGTLLGVLVICTINNGLILIGVKSFWTTLVRGLVILIAVYIDSIRKHREESGK